MDTILMNSKNSKTSDLDRLLLNFIEKTNLKRSEVYLEKYIYICGFIKSYTIHGKI